MTAPNDPVDHVGKVLALTDRNQRFARIASLAGYAVWIVATFRFIRLAEQSGLSPEVTTLCRHGALLMLFGGMATQFMICNYINAMARNTLHAVHVVQQTVARGATRNDEPAR
jgi:hypothetical protein